MLQTDIDIYGMLCYDADMKIAEYKLKITDEEQVIDIPWQAEFLTVQLQYNEIVIWALVDDEASSDPRTFVLRTTGDYVGGGDIYIGTVQTHIVKTTYHLFLL